ncbi:MAG: hypothetical protein M1823_003914 [Watsoniomyces obsoletus]|nr:MAG: hypothetical protein M1823_003914 [Watsoniomyces obsoletus]
MSADYAYAPRAPPPGAALPALRRHRDHQSPAALTTAVGPGQRGSSYNAGQTPSTASSTLSSAGVGYGPQPFTASPVTSSNNTSPVGSGGTSLSYDPSAWTSGGRHRPPPVLANNRSSGYGDGIPTHSPPPPYSPQRMESRQDRTSPVDRPHAPYRPQAPGSRLSRDITHAPHAADSGPRGESGLSFPPPPSATSGRRDRSSSRNANDRVQPLFSLSALSSRVRSTSQLSTPPRPDAAGMVAPPAPPAPPVDISRRALTIHSSSSRDLAPAGQPAESRPPPPSSRRSSSTGALAAAQSSQRLRAERPSPTSSAAWTPGMPLPPPPPGPPPTTRSQSLNRSMGLSAGEEPGPRPGTGMPTRRPPTTRSSLPPVPPTPAGWIDPSETVPAPPNGVNARGSSLAREPSFEGHEEARYAPGAQNGVPEPVGSRPSTDQSMKGIRERRSESRTRKGIAGQGSTSPSEPSNNPWAADLEFEAGDPLMPANLVLPVSASPGLARRPALSKSSPRSPRAPTSLDGPSRRMTSSSASDSTGVDNVMTPNGKAPSASGSSYTNTVTTPPPWATPRSAQYSERGLSGSPTLQDDSADGLMPAPLTPSRASAARGATNADDFARAAVERHRAFIEREAAAGTDRERVQLFTEFIVKESRLRSSRYTGAIESMGSQMSDLTRDLFRPYPEIEAPSSNSTRQPAKNSRPSPRTSLNQVVHEAFRAPTQQPPPTTRPETAWWGGYMPSLSPIPSMSASIVPDEMSSRGRAPSRWWEASQTGSIAGGGGRGVERSKRESKYMGLPLRDWEDAPSSSHATAGPSAQQMLEYPPEKAGWHEQVTPRSSDPRKLDVSRLVTLPPPYPRHYPAVNNHHPTLATLRGLVRGLADMSEVKRIKQEFSDRHGDGSIECDTQRRLRLDDVRKMVETGRMSYAEAAQVEEEEKRSADEALKADLEAYRMEVLKPLQTLLSQRIATATDAFETLTRQLGEHNPVEEGDEKPELLEKLTLLKWVFEARELLHREEYELSRAGNERYHRAVAASCPDERKMSEMRAFFERTEIERRAQVEKEALVRFEHFTDVVESTVEKGVEVQLSTFWDIAPPLVDVIQKIQVEKGVQADVEYDFSQQYLWEVLTHAEKSAYQFIEAQINLLCLLHEVKSGMTKQGGKVMMAERRLAGDMGIDEDEEEELAEVVKAEEERLTADLKDKVTTVEEQWHEAMGQVVEPLKERVREWLQRHGGWEGLEDD